MFARHAQSLRSSKSSSTLRPIQVVALIVLLAASLAQSARASAGAPVQPPTGCDASYGNGSISGTVTAADTGGDLSGISVTAYGCYLRFGGQPVSTVTNYAGQYTLSGLASGYYTLSFAPSYNALAPVKEYVPSLDEHAAGVREPANTTLNVSLLHGGKVTGRVTDGSDIPLSNINVYASDGVMGASGNTNMNGEYTITGLPSGAYTITFTPWSSMAQFAIQNYSVTVSVAAPNTTPDVNGVLTVMAGFITGTVRVADTGLPVSFGQVVIQGIDNHYEGYGYIPCYCGLPAGSYGFRGLAPGRYRVLASSPGSVYIPTYYGGAFTAESATVITVTSGVTRTGVDITLPAGGQISGTVADTGGYLVTDIGVDVLDAGGALVASSTTNNSGAYVTSPGLPSGNYRVHFHSGSSKWFCTTDFYSTRYYSGSNSLEQATLVSVVQGSVTSNVDAVLVPLRVHLPYLSR
jgi:hypothetical protein